MVKKIPVIVCVRLAGVCFCYYVAGVSVLLPDTY